MEVVLMFNKNLKEQLRYAQAELNEFKEMVLSNLKRISETHIATTRLSKELDELKSDVEALVLIARHQEDTHEALEDLLKRTNIEQPVKEALLRLKLKFY
jgi:hypothetical protein